jgi:hypothetical protein
VVAVNSGGPLETVAGDETEEQTGILCDQNAAAFAEVVWQLSFVLFVLVYTSLTRIEHRPWLG